MRHSQNVPLNFKAATRANFFFSLGSRIGPHGEHHFVLAYVCARTSEILLVSLANVNFIKWKTDYD